MNWRRKHGIVPLTVQTDFDRGLLTHAVKFLANNIWHCSYEEAHLRCLQWQTFNPNPNDPPTRRGREKQTAHAPDAAHHFHLIKPLWQPKPDTLAPSWVTENSPERHQRATQPP